MAPEREIAGNGAPPGTYSLSGPIGGPMTQRGSPLSPSLSLLSTHARTHARTRLRHAEEAHGREEVHPAGVEGELADGARLRKVDQNAVPEHLQAVAEGLVGDPVLRGRVLGRADALDGVLWRGAQRSAGAGGREGGSRAGGGKKRLRPRKRPRAERGCAPCT